jgi:hypothetical protein
MIKIKFIDIIKHKLCKSNDFLSYLSNINWILKFQKFSLHLSINPINLKLTQRKIVELALNTSLV